MVLSYLVVVFGVSKIIDRFFYEKVVRKEENLHLSWNMKSIFKQQSQFFIKERKRERERSVSSSKMLVLKLVLKIDAKNVTFSKNVPSKQCVYVKCMWNVYFFKWIDVFKGRSREKKGKRKKVVKIRLKFLII